MIQDLLEKELLWFTTKLESIDVAGALKCRYQLIVEAHVKSTPGALQREHRGSAG
jgi:hypothetical protein